jgi:3'-phosphoadenosine 5'-phosphosulfate sulfotransferase (PAPS reductase)/FAD synthetase
MSVYHDTLNHLRSLAAKHSEVLVAYSGGKDSLAVMELCAKIFTRVRAFNWYTAPGLRVTEQWMDFARTRWGVDPIMIPHWDIVQCKKVGLWCNPTIELDLLPEYGLREAYAHALDVARCEIVVAGMKRADGLKRRQFFANIRDSNDPFWTRLVNPIADWRKADVIGFLKANNIPLPQSIKGAVTSGVSLTHSGICWLHDNHPDDYRKLLKWFPYAEACIKRREWFGVGRKT